MALDETLSLIDTNVLLAMIDTSDALHQKANETFDRLQKEDRRLIFLSPVIEEATTFVFLKREPVIIEQFIEQTKDDQAVIWRDVETAVFLNAFSTARSFQYHPKMSLTDWTLLYLATTWNVPLVTFDKQLHNAWKKLA